jgi:hypothetical protein
MGKKYMNENVTLIHFRNIGGLPANTSEDASPEAVGASRHPIRHMRALGK